MHGQRGLRRPRGQEIPLGLGRHSGKALGTLYNGEGPRLQIHGAGRSGGGIDQVADHVARDWPVEIGPHGATTLDCLDQRHRPSISCKRKGFPSCGYFPTLRGVRGTHFLGRSSRTGRAQHRRESPKAARASGVTEQATKPSARPISPRCFPFYDMPCRGMAR